jgi:hypothetical protein
MAKRSVLILLAWFGVSLGVAIALSRVKPVEAVPAFARQYDVQCTACHTRPPRLNSFGEQFHLMGFQMPSAARPGGLVAAYKEDGPLKFLLDSVALRAEGGIFEYTYAPKESETKWAPPDEITLYVTRSITPDLTVFVELEYAPNAVAFQNGRYFTEGEAGVGHEAFFMLNLGRVLGWLGAPTMEMGGMTMVGRHGGFNLHGPMMMAGKIDPSTNFSYATNRQLILDTELEIDHGAVERLPIVPYAFTSKFFGLFKSHEAEPLLTTDQVMYNTRGQPGVDLHSMFMNNLYLGQIGFMAENGGFNAYGVFRFDLGQREDFTFNASALVNWGFGNQFAPDPDDLDHPGQRVDRLRLGLAANARWKRLDVYGAVIWDRLYNLPRGLDGVFKNTGTGLTVQADYLLLEQVMLSGRFDQLWAGGVNDQRQNGSVFTVQARYYPWPNIAFFIRNSTNRLSVVDENPLRNWRNQFFIGIDWDF